MDIIGLIFWTAVKAAVGYVLTYKGLESFFKIYLIVFGVILNIPLFLIGIPFILAFGIGIIFMALAVIDYYAIKYGGEEGRKRKAAELPLWPF